LEAKGQAQPAGKETTAAQSRKETEGDKEK
jgi:hypothetical protein